MPTTSFRHYVWAQCPKQIDESNVTVLRSQVPAGEEAHI